MNSNDILKKLNESILNIETKESLYPQTFAYLTVEDVKDIIEYITFIKSNIHNMAYQQIELSMEKSSLQRDDLIKKLRLLSKI